MVTSVRSGEEWAPVTDADRGQAIQRRRLAQGFKSERQFAVASGVSREAIKAAESGTARGDTYQRLEQFLDSFEHEVGEDVPTYVQQIEVTVDGEKVTVTTKGPVVDPDALEESVRRIVRGIREQS